MSGNLDAGNVICAGAVVFDISALSTPSGWTALSTSSGTPAVAPNFAITAYGAGTDFTHESRVKKWSGGVFVSAPDGSTGKAGVAAFCVGKPTLGTTNTAMAILFDNVSLQNFDIGYMTTSNSYLCTWYNCRWMGYTSRCILIPPGIGTTNRSNSGENFQIFGGVMANGTGICIDSSAADVYIRGVSFDYNTAILGVTRGQSFLSFQSCHIEWSGNNGYFFVSSEDTSFNNVILVEGCQFTQNPQQGAAIQSSYIAYAGDSGRCYIKFKNNQFNNVTYPSTYSAGPSWCGNAPFSTDHTPITVLSVGGRIQADPLMTGATTAGAVTFTGNTGGYWVIVEGFCIFSLTAQWSAYSGTGTTRFSMDNGMPSNRGNYDVAVSVSQSGFSTTSGAPVYARVLAGTNQIVLHTVTSAGVSADIACGNSGIVRLSGQYPII